MARKGAKPPKAPKANGRPKATPEEIEARWPALNGILDRMSQGDTLRTICREGREKDTNFPADGTVRMWSVKDEPEGFAAQYARAREAQAEAWADDILEIADETNRDTITKVSKSGEEYESADHEWINRSRLRVDSRKWLMSKLVPGKYGEKLDVTSGGEKLPPQSIVIAGKEVTF